MAPELPDYSTRDPKGWAGDPRRGAAVGRPTVQKGDPETFTGKLVLREVPLNDGGYDRNGTYFGLGPPLYWCAGGDGDEHDIDYMLRASDREAAKRKVRERYPNARFYR